MTAPTFQELQALGEKLMDKAIEIYVDYADVWRMSHGYHGSQLETSDPDVIARFADIPGLFEITAGTNPEHLDAIVDNLIAARDALDFASIGDMAGRISDQLNMWEGDGVYALENNYIGKFSVMAESQVQAIEAVMVDIDAYRQQVEDIREKLKTTESYTWWALHRLVHGDGISKATAIEIIKAVAGATLTISTLGGAGAVGVITTTIPKFKDMALKSILTQTLDPAAPTKESYITGNNPDEVVDSMRLALAGFRAELDNAEELVAASLNELLSTLQNSPNGVYHLSEPELVALANSPEALMSAEGFGSHT